MSQKITMAGKVVLEILFIIIIIILTWEFDYYHFFKIPSVASVAKMAVYLTCAKDRRQLMSLVYDLMSCVSAWVRECCVCVCLL